MTVGKRKRRGCGCCGCPGCLLPAAVLLWAVVALWHGFKPLPQGLRIEGQPIGVASGDMQLLADVTALDPLGEQFSEHVIFDRMIHHIARAHHRLLIDNFYFNTKRYDLAKVGRYKVNRKLGLDLPLDQSVLTLDDVLATIEYILRLHADMPTFEGPRGEVVVETDDIDGLYGELSRAEVVHPVSRGGVRETHFGTREFATVDTDGNLVEFFCRME